MPHCIIEHSQSAETKVDIAALSAQLHQTLIAMGHFTPNAIKTRSRAYDNYHVGEYGKGADFIHITLYLLAGRPVELRQEIANTLFEYVKETATNVESVSVDIQEMNAQTYCK